MSSNILYKCGRAILLWWRGKNYLADEIKALEWIFSTNRRGKNLVEECGIGVPWRMMDKKGRINIRGQNFKGAYEVGSYIMALSDIL